MRCRGQFRNSLPGGGMCDVHYWEGHHHHQGCWHCRPSRWVCAASLARCEGHDCVHAESNSGTASSDQGRPWKAGSSLSLTVNQEAILSGNKCREKRKGIGRLIIQRYRLKKRGCIRCNLLQYWLCLAGGAYLYLLWAGCLGCTLTYLSISEMVLHGTIIVAELFTIINELWYCSVTVVVFNLCVPNQTCKCIKCRSVNVYTNM